MVPFIKSTELQTMSLWCRWWRPQQRNSKTRWWYAGWVIAIFKQLYFLIIAYLLPWQIQVDYDKSIEESIAKQNSSFSDNSAVFLSFKKSRKTITLSIRLCFTIFQFSSPSTLFSSRFYNNMGVNSLLTQRVASWRTAQLIGCQSFRWCSLTLVMMKNAKSMPSTLSYSARASYSLSK